MSARDVLRSFAESRSADHEPIPARLTYGQVREALRLIEELETRVRPVAEWVPAQGLRGDEPHGFAGSLWLGQVALGYVSVHRAHGIVDHAARCHIDGKGEYFRDPDPASARAWLEARVRAAGFEVREESSRG